MKPNRPLKFKLVNDIACGVRVSKKGSPRIHFGSEEFANFFLRFSSSCGRSNAVDDECSFYVLDVESEKAIGKQKPKFELNVEFLAGTESWYIETVEVFSMPVWTCD